VVCEIWAVLRIAVWSKWKTSDPLIVEAMSWKIWNVRCWKLIKYQRTYEILLLVKLKMQSECQGHSASCRYSGTIIQVPNFLFLVSQTQMIPQTEISPSSFIVSDNVVCGNLPLIIFLVC
jgi:hypothetical protein